MSEEEKQNREELFRLMRENPDLQVIPFADADMMADDSGYWMGGWGSASVDEYLIPEDDYPVIFKSDNDVFDTLEKMLPWEEFEKLPDDEEACRPIYERLPWKKAIIVYITTPDWAHEGGKP